MRRELAVEAAEVPDPLQVGGLVHDDVRCGLADGGHDGGGVEQIGDDRHGSGARERRLLGGSAGHARHVMAALAQKRDQAAAEGAGGAGDEYVHGRMTRHTARA